MTTDGVPSVADLVGQVGRRLAAAAGGDADREASAAARARILVAHVAGVEPRELIMAPGLNTAHLRRLDELIAQHLGGIPLQHLVGEVWFRRIRLAIGPGAFIPRPETEVVAGWAIDRLNQNRPAGRRARVVDLGTGSGAIAAAIADEVSDVEVYAVELSEDALVWARRNLAETGVELRHGDLADAFADLDGTVDLIVSNPPYIPLENWADVSIEVRDHEPQLALFSGPDGLDAMRAVAATAYRLLRPGAVVVAEHGDVQGESAPAVFTAHGGFHGVRDHRDLTDRPRFVTATRNRGNRGETGALARWHRER